MASIPTVTSNVPRDLKNFVDRVREALDGTGEDSLVTVRSLIASGVVNYNGGSMSPTAGVSTAGTPAAPLNLEAEGALSNIVLTWDKPIYRGHAYTEIWAATQSAEQEESDTEPTLGDADLIGMAPGNFFAHSVGAGAASVFWYWVRFVNIDGTAGPYNATEGTRGATAPDPTYLLELLTGQITESQLFSDLGARLEGIEDNAAAVSAQAETIGEIQAKYSVKVDVAGHVAGFGLIAQDNDGTVESEFGVRADSFFIAPPAYHNPTPPQSDNYLGRVWTNSDTGVTKYYGGEWYTNEDGEYVKRENGPWIDYMPSGGVPFVVRTAPTTINGVECPPGVYMANAFIANGTITNAMIGNATIDSAKIVELDAGKIRSGYIDADRIEAGSIRADMIDSRGLTIKDENGNILLGAGTAIRAEDITGLGDLAYTDTIGVLNLNATLQEQLDGKAESFFQSTDPAEDYGWLTDDVDNRQLHVNDMWWKTDTNELFSYVFDAGAIPPAPSYLWVRRTDAAVTGAYEAAADAQEAADGKITTFTDDPTTPYGIGDLWVRDGDLGIWTCVSGREAGVYQISDWRRAADTTSQNQAASIFNQGAFATESTITAENVGTYIESGAITNAYIGNVIQSTNYRENERGWKIDKDGQMEMNDAVFRGTLALGSTTGTGARMEFTRDYIRVIDENGNETVRIGKLTD